MNEPKEMKVSRKVENILMYYANEKSRLEEEFQELLKAEQEVLKELVGSSGFGNGDYGLEQRPEGLILTFTPTEEQEEESSKPQEADKTEQPAE